MIRYLVRCAVATIPSRSRVVARYLLGLFLSPSVKMRNVLCIVVLNGTSTATTKVHPRSRSNIKIKRGNDDLPRHGTFSSTETFSRASHIYDAIVDARKHEAVSFTARTVYRSILVQGGYQGASGDMLTESSSARGGVPLSQRVQVNFSGIWVALQRR